MHKAVQKRGRPPRAGVARYADGQVARQDKKPLESTEEVTATALDARYRRLLGVDEWKRSRRKKEALEAARKKVSNPLLSEENPLGRLLFVGRTDVVSGITQDQYDAGQYFMRAHKQNAFVTNPQRAPAVAAGANLMGPGDYTGPPPDNDLHGPAYELDLDRAIDAQHEKQIRDSIADVKRKWANVMRAVIDADEQRGHVFSVMRKVLIDCRDPEGLAEIGALRIGLNAINRARGA